MSSSSKSQSQLPPGSDGIWIFVFIDMVVFFLMFMTCISERYRIPDVFAASQLKLNLGMGFANTLILLTSSWFVVEAVRSARDGASDRTTRFLSLALLCGLAFSVIKIFEYQAKVQAGLVPSTNAFFSLYFVITGIHFLHVIGGMIFMMHCRNRAGQEVGSATFRTKLENVGLFWHFVDLLWVFIFPLLYIAGAR